MLTLANMKEWLNLEETTEHDTLLTLLETRVVQYLESRMDQKLAGVEAGIVEILSGNGARSVYTTSRIVDLTKVELRDSISGDFSDQTLADFEADGHRVSRLQGAFPDGQADQFGQVFPPGFHNVRLTYDGGFASAPEDVRQAAFELVETWFRERVTSGGGQIPFREASSEVPSTPRTVEAVIDHYRRLPGT